MARLKFKDLLLIGACEGVGRGLCACCDALYAKTPSCTPLRLAARLSLASSMGFKERLFGSRYAKSSNATTPDPFGMRKSSMQALMSDIHGGTTVSPC
eukprot:1097493-Amphidinium_carterae.2